MRMNELQGKTTVLNLSPHTKNEPEVFSLTLLKFLMPLRSKIFDVFKSNSKIPPVDERYVELGNDIIIRTKQVLEEVVFLIKFLADI